MAVLVSKNGIPSDIVSLFGARTVDTESLDLYEVLFGLMEPCWTV
jgi:hypothetical protein